MQQRYTTAPNNYDGFGTYTVEETEFTDKRGREFRLVHIEEQHLQWQEMRYGSGMYQCLTADQFNKELQLGFTVCGESVFDLLRQFWPDAPCDFNPLLNVEHALQIAHGIARYYVNSLDTSVNFLTLAQTNVEPDHRDQNLWAASFDSLAHFDNIEEWIEPHNICKTKFTARGTSPAEAITRAAYKVARYQRKVRR